MAKLNSYSDLQQLKEQINFRRDPDRMCVTVCSGTGCLAYRSQDLLCRALYRQFRLSSFKILKQEIFFKSIVGGASFLNDIPYLKTSGEI